MTTPNLKIPELANSQVNQYITANEALRILEQASTGRLTVDFSTNAASPVDSNFTLSAVSGSEQWRDLIVEFTDTTVVLSAARDVIFPSENGPFYIFINSTAQTLTAKISGQTGVEIDPGVMKRIYHDGTDMAEDQATILTTGRLTKNFATDANITLTAAESIHKFITMTDTSSPLTLTAGRDVIFPAINGPEVIIDNQTAQTLTIKISGQTGVTLASGVTNRFFYDGTDMVAGP